MLMIKVNNIYNIPQNHSRSTPDLLTVTKSKIYGFMTFVQNGKTIWIFRHDMHLS